MSLPVRFRKEKPKIDKSRLRGLFFGSLSFIGVILGLFLCFSITMDGVKFLNSTPENTAIGELAFACNRAMSHNDIRDTGGCRCIAKAALTDETLGPKRTKALQVYFEKLETTTETLNGHIPSQLEVSRSVGLIYGHPFLRAYGQCMQTGLQSDQTKTTIN
ncbi:hypothetical protein [Hirschia litorea]|uniref:Uncharacterized protein n=1 Tax=Hirschia litorea TaxID=1199156 RepID=A0ABW2IGA1_9PROT